MKKYWLIRNEKEFNLAVSRGFNDGGSGYSHYYNIEGGTFLVSKKGAVWGSVLLTRENYDLLTEFKDYVKIFDNIH